MVIIPLAWLAICKYEGVEERRIVETLVRMYEVSNKFKMYAKMNAVVTNKREMLWRNEVVIRDQILNCNSDAKPGCLCICLGLTTLKRNIRYTVLFYLITPTALKHLHNFYNIDA